MLRTGKLLKIFAVAVAMSAGLAHAVIAQSFSYSRIETSGNLRIDDNSLIQISGLPDSGTVSADELNAAFRAISDRALFEEISIVPRGDVLEINVLEFPTINRIAFEGNRTIRDEQLEQVVLSKPREVFVPANIENDADRLAEAYFSSGRLAASVTPVIIRRSQNRVDVVFEIIEGRVVEIENITFIGNNDFSDTRLRRVLETKQAGVLRTFITSDTYLPDRIELDKSLLRDFYLARGYLDFEILSATTEISKARNSLSLIFKVEEGQSYTIREITASSEIDGIDPMLYLAESRIRPGDRYTPTAVDDTIKRMLFLANAQGYEFVTVTPELTTVGIGNLDIDLRIAPDSPSIIERIEIVGNDTTVDRVIRRHFDRLEGDPHDEESLERTADRIRDLGLFGRVNVDATPISATQTVITTSVEERNTGSLGVGLTYAKQSGVGYTLSLTERNLLGRGQTIGVSISAGDDERSYSLHFVEPYLLDRDLEFGFNIGSDEIENFAGFADFNESDLGSYLAFPISERGRLTADIGYTRQKSKRPPQRVVDESRLIDWQFPKPNNKREFVSIGLSYSHDTISSGVYTDRGFRFGISQRLSFSDRTTVAKTQASVTGQTVRGKATLQARLRGGFVASTGNRSTHIFDRFHSNTSIIRGFESYGIGPRTGYHQLPLGGNRFVSLQLEALHPIVEGDINVSGALFTDAATIWGLDDTNDCNNVEEIPNKNYCSNRTDSMKGQGVDDGSKIRATTGVGLIVGTPIGPMRFDFSKAFRKYAGDRTQSFSLTFGSSF